MCESTTCIRLEFLKLEVLLKVWSVVTPIHVNFFDRTKVGLGIPSDVSHGILQFIPVITKEFYWSLEN